MRVANACSHPSLWKNQARLRLRTSWGSRPITRIKVIMHMHSYNRSCSVCLSFFRHLLGYIRRANRKVYGRMTCIKLQRSASSSPPITVHRGKADGVLCRALETFFLVWNNLAIFLHRGKVCWTNMLPRGCIPTFEGRSFPHKCG